MQILTADEVRKILEELLKAYLPPPWVPWIFLLAAALGSFLMTRAKNQALLRDIGKLTEIAEQVRAKVSGGLWLNQTRWTVRKELYFSLLESLNELLVAYRQMEQLCETVDPAKPNFEKLADEIVERLKTARKAFTRAKSPTGIVLNEAALAALEVLEKEEARLTEEAVKDLWEALAGHINPLQEAITQVTLAAKEDLRLFEAEKEVADVIRDVASE
jgi:hypothetical protein